jgi:hypothetical protein
MEPQDTKKVKQRAKKKKPAVKKKGVLERLIKLFEAVKEFVTYNK